VKTPCGEIAADAMGLLALSPDAPERASAEAHARGCADCARALDEGRRLLALLDGEGATLPAPSPAALARESAPVLAELDGTARVGAGRLTAAVVAAVLAAWALPLALARAPVAGGPPLAFSLALAVVAAVASAATVRWGGRLAVAFPLLSAIGALAAGSGRALGGLAGLHCTAIEAATAAGAGAATWLAARALGAGAPRPAVLVAATGGGALAGHAALHLACGGASELPHLLVFHTAPIALLVGVGLALAAAARPVTRASRP